jgi:phosphohistidine phosphatase SixA
MLVGHNPNLTELLGLLIGMTAYPLPFELKKAGVAALTTHEPGQDGFRLEWLAPPALLRRVRG